MNYAQALEVEAYRLARYKIIKALKGTEGEDRLDGYLARLDSIHAENMALAAEWSPPVTKLPPLTANDVTTAAVIPAASSLVTKAQADEESA